MLTLDRWDHEHGIVHHLGNKATNVDDFVPLL